MPDHIDPASAALYAAIALVFVVTGGVLVASNLALEVRAAALGTAFGVLAVVAIWGRRKP